MSPQSQVEPERQAVSSEAAERYVPLEKSKRQGIGLCLSGGGYRATLFHMGALRRLNECGVLTREDFRSVCSVSGGSIARRGARKNQTSSEFGGYCRGRLEPRISRAAT